MTKAQLNKIRNNKKITHCYIKKNGIYYRPGYCGYTDYAYKAGIYEKEVAIKYVEGYAELYIIPINNEEHNSMILAEVKELTSRIIA